MPIADVAARAAYRREWRRRNPEKMANQRFRQTYGITLAERDAMLERQGDVCAICGTDDPGNGWTVDHDHSCCPGPRSCRKCIRSILCWNCNVGIGLFRDNAAVLLNVIDYLTFHRQRMSAPQVKCCECETVVPVSDYWLHVATHKETA